MQNKLYQFFKIDWCREEKFYYFSKGKSFCKFLLALYNHCLKKELWILCITLEIYGAPEEIRTPDRLLRRQLLYPTELLAHYIIVIISKSFVNLFCLYFFRFVHKNS